MSVRSLACVLPIVHIVCFTRVRLASAASQLSTARARIVDGHGLDVHGRQRSLVPASLYKVGDGPGRPLFSLNTVDVPLDPTGELCVSLRMDSRTHALTVDTLGADANSLAWGCFNDTLAQKGWNSLSISSSSDQRVPLAVRAYGVGLLEGLLTRAQLSSFNRTVRELLVRDLRNNSASIAAVDRVLRMSLIAWETLSGGDAVSVPQDDIARQAWCALLQLRGIRDGHNVMAEKTGGAALSIFNMMYINMHVELPAVSEVYGDSEEAKILGQLNGTLTPQPGDASLLQMSRTFSGKVKRRLRAQHQKHMKNRGAERQHTSKSSTTTWGRWSSHIRQGAALVVRSGPQGNPRDLLTGHATYGNYGEMLRMMKTYSFSWGTPVQNITMSSYPGCISSTDDYFMTGQGLAMISANLFVPSTGEFSKPALTNEGLPSFLRAVIAAKLAAQAHTWPSIYGFLAGIAGAQQWLIVDYSKFQKGKTITNGTVLFAEALPRVMRYADVSSAVHESGFFAAHGVPHFRQIREIYGLPGEGPGSYKEHLQSALLDQAQTVQSMANAREMFGRIEPSRQGVGQQTIVARNDLSAADPIPEGTIDVKLTSRCFMQYGMMQAKSGPPTDYNHPPFDWGALPEWPHYGLPPTWNFPWVNVAPGSLSPMDDTLSQCENSNTNSTR